ncbi:MAG: undecaprenyldiphospho-muramoylpentapeptide beta-N-acetylglucosaminyltransferase [Acidimicrobiales bacterium]|nr:undecaprenyldiphospho-muramoylpentapeptide beta-N-acetylglucosaminyltransferase [Acidimicrobiales bacterium]MDG2218940.1 undecaprenyldiphospho-muramoylpentapeptide beta-N-acetylglucosaminyltransferase [Acidimicrobiales bacterium]
MSARADTWAIIAGGGTAGHVTPGLSIAREIQQRGVRPEQIKWVGSQRGIEVRLVPEAGFPLELLPGRGIQRRLTRANVGAVLGLVRAIFRALILVRRARPSIVIGLGGYASVPCILAAVVWRIPIVVAEQNAVPGAANRLAARFAKACALSFADTDLQNGTWTGNPVSPEILAVDRLIDRASARGRLGIEDERLLLAVFGGSLGARRINNALIDALGEWRDCSTLAVRLVGGSRDHADLANKNPISEHDTVQFTLVEYEDDMPSVYAAADLVVCRAGASSVAEIAAIGVPAVLVPLPGAPGDHQTANARALVNAGAAVMVTDGELDGARLHAEVDALIAEPDRLHEMSQRAKGVARRDAAEAVVDLVVLHARRPLPSNKEAV